MVFMVFYFPGIVTSVPDGLDPAGTIETASSFPSDKTSFASVTATPCFKGTQPSRVIRLAQRIASDTITAAALRRSRGKRLPGTPKAPRSEMSVKEMVTNFQPMATAVLVATMVLVMGGAAQAANTDKTLVAWVTLTDKNIRSGSVLTVQVGAAFDGIIFAERAARKWMAGSDGFRRTGNNPGAFPAETADSKTMVQMAIVYKGDQISIYRNAKQYASYKTRNIDLLSGKNNFAVFGLRHIGGDGSIGGSIDDARIYSKALTAEEIKSLTPNKESTVKPYAWWSRATRGRPNIASAPRASSSPPRPGDRAERARTRSASNAITARPKPTTGSDSTTSASHPSTSDPVPSRGALGEIR